MIHPSPNDTKAMTAKRDARLGQEVLEVLVGDVALHVSEYGPVVSVRHLAFFARAHLAR